MLIIGSHIHIQAKDFTVLLSCDRLAEYTALCADDSAPTATAGEIKEYPFSNNIKWGYGDANGSAYIGDVEIRYIDFPDETFKTTTDSMGKFTAMIQPNKAFFAYAYNHIAGSWATHGEKFILRISSSTGNLLWKEWKPSTHRWIRLDIESNVYLTPKPLISNIQVLDITNRGAVVTWEGEADAKVWLVVKGTSPDPFIHVGVNNKWIFSQLGAGYTFTLSVMDSNKQITTTEFSTKE